MTLEAPESSATRRFDAFDVFRYPGVDVSLPRTTQGGGADRAYQVDFRYELAGVEGSEHFTETVTFPAPAIPPSQDMLHAFTRLVHLAYVAAGTSYYKVAAPAPYRGSLDRRDAPKPRISTTALLPRHG